MAAGILGSRALSKGAPERTPATAGLDFAAVYEAHFRYVWRCLRGLGVREPALDDAIQDVFLVVQRRLVEFDGKGELRTWLYAIALRVARKYWSREHQARARTEPSDGLSEAAVPTSDGEHIAESNERLSLAQRALLALDDDKRVVFVLARVEQMSAPEIAAILSVPLNTVYSRLRAARAAFEAEVRRLQRRGSTSP